MEEVAMRIFKSIDELAAAVGEEIGPTDWLQIDQKRVNQFADATGDHQWIHVDIERAQAGPFGGTIAHGYLTLALLPWIASQLFHIDTLGAKLNYGINKVRFPNVVKVGAKLRGTCSIVSVTPLASGNQMVMRYVIEIEGEDKPACVAETVVLLL
jgi:acyl dehydratase